MQPRPQPGFRHYQPPGNGALIKRVLGMIP